MSRLAVPVAALLLFACASSPDGDGGEPQSVSPHADVYLMAIGPLPEGRLDRLAEFYRERLGIEVAVARPMPFHPRLYDARRKQLVAEELVALLEVWCDGLAENPRAIFVGITTTDMYSRSRNQRFSFAYQGRGRYAVVSSARLWFSPEGEPEPSAVVEARVRKIVTQAIGLLYYDLPLNDDPRSVLSAQVLSIGGLDAIDESTLERDILEADAARFR